MNYLAGGCVIVHFAAKSFSESIHLGNPACGRTLILHGFMIKVQYLY